MINTNNEELIQKGFYIGKTTELFEDINQFHSYIDEMVNITTEKDLFKYRYQISLPPNIDQSSVPVDIKKLHIDIDLIPVLDKFVNENNISVFQRWWETNDKGYLSNALNYFRSAVENALVEIYPDLKDNFYHHDNFTLYKNGDFIQAHKDGYNVGRYCVVLVYLSHEKDYNDGGGEIVILENNLEEKVVPINENFCILDFTKNNPNHAVNQVKNDFKRYTYIDFVYNRRVHEEFMKENQNKII